MAMSSKDRRNRYHTDPEYRRKTLERNAARRARVREQFNEERKRRYLDDPTYRESVNAANRTQHDKHREKRLSRMRARWLERTYSLAQAQWDAMLIAQSGRCDICLDPMADPHVDHDHRSGVVRSLLCGSCNRGVGHFKDDPTLLVAAIEYLDRHAG